VADKKRLKVRAIIFSTPGLRGVHTKRGPAAATKLVTIMKTARAE
jgi:hypothetical protein